MWLFKYIVKIFLWIFFNKQQAVVKRFLDLNPPTLPQSFLSHSTVAQAWGAQTRCQRLDFPELRASLCSPGTRQVIPCCCPARSVFARCVCAVALTQPAAGAGWEVSSWARQLWPWRVRAASARVTLPRCVCEDTLLFTEARAESLLGPRAPPQRGSASWKLRPHSAALRAGYRRACLSEICLYSETLKLPFLLSETIAQNHMHWSAFS